MVDFRDIRNTIGSFFAMAGSMAGNAFVGDVIHDGVEKLRDGVSKPKAKEPKIIAALRPLAGLAGTTPENEERYTRLFMKLKDNDQAAVAEFSLEYFVKAKEQGLLTGFIAGQQYDAFMLRVVNLSSPGKSTGTTTTTTVTNEESPRTDRTANRFGFKDKQKTVDVNRTSTTGGTKKQTTAVATAEHFTPSGSEGLKFLQELAYRFRIGGMQAAEDHLKLLRMPTVEKDGITHKFDAFLRQSPQELAAHAEMRMQREKSMSPFRRFMRGSSKMGT